MISAPLAQTADTHRRSAGLNSPDCFHIKHTANQETYYRHTHLIVHIVKTVNHWKPAYSLIISFLTICSQTVLPGVSIQNSGSSLVLLHAVANECSMLLQHCPHPGTHPAPLTRSQSRCPWPTSPTRQTWLCPVFPARKYLTPGNASSLPKSWSRSPWSKKHARSSSPRTWRWPALSLSVSVSEGGECF